MHYLQKSWHYKELQREITPIVLAPIALRFLLLVFVLKIGMCLQGLMKFHQRLFKILRKLSIQKPLRTTKGNNSNSIHP